MKITYWTDYRCPFCYIGVHQVKEMVKTLPDEIKDDITYEMKSFELEPDAPKEVDYTTVDVFSRKYGLTKDQAAERVGQISEIGHRVGLPGMDYGGAVPTNSFAAHRLTKLAIIQGHPENEDLLMKAYFDDHENLSDKKVLKRIAVGAGMDEDEVDELLNGGRYDVEVRKDEEEAYRLGVTGVPFFVVDDEQAWSGANSDDSMKEWILEKKKREDEMKKLTATVKEGDACRMVDGEFRCG